MKYVMIGLGGNGGIIASFLLQFLMYEKCKERIILVEGDDFEPENKPRQRFSRFGNKARVLSEDFLKEFPDLTILPISRYIEPGNIASIIEEGDVVFLAVDGHPARRFVSDYCSTLNDIVLFSCGNEFDDGNAQVFLKRGGKEITTSLTYAHPEIENAKGPIVPEQPECGARRESDPQLLFTNLMAASITLNAFYEWYTTGTIGYCEVYFSIKRNQVRPVPTTDRRRI